MANVVQVFRLFEDDGDATGETWRYGVLFDGYDYSMREARMATDGTTSIPADGSIIVGTSWLSTSSARRDKDNPHLCYVDVKFEAPNGGNEAKPDGVSQKWNIEVT